MRIIKIEKCLDCPFCNWVGDNQDDSSETNFSCQETGEFLGSEGWVRDEPDSINKWEGKIPNTCPLEIFNDVNSVIAYKIYDELIEKVSSLWNEMSFDESELVLAEIRELLDKIKKIR